MAIRNTTPKRVRDDVHKYIEDDDFEKAVTVLRTGMKATQIVRGTTDIGQRGMNYVEIPDHGTRLTSARLMLEYGFGKPATRHDITVDDKSRKTASPAEIMRRIQDSGVGLGDILETYTESLPKVREMERIELGTTKNGKNEE